MRLTKGLTLGLFAITTFMSCSERKETPLPEIVAKVQLRDSCVYRLRLNSKGQGFSIHNLTWDKWDSIEDRWIFIDKNKGRVYGENVSVSMFKTYKEPSNFRGYIDVDSLTMVINLEVFDYDNKVKGDWAPSKYNGTFKIVYIDKDEK